MRGIKNFESPWRFIVRLGAGRLTLAALLVFAGAPSVWSQGFGADPFRPYNSQYDAYIYPVAPSMNYGYNNAPPRVGGATTYQNYVESLGSSTGARGGNGVGVHYNQANRAYDRELGRIYEPNRKADAEFQARQEAANDIYFKYFREKDPKKRGELLRRYNRARGREERDLNSSSGVTRFRRSPAARDRADTARERSRSARSAEDGPPPLAGSRPTSRRGSSAATGAGTGTGHAPAAPRPAAAPATDATTAPRREETPSEILERAKQSEPESAPPIGGAPRQPANGPPPIE